MRRVKGIVIIVVLAVLAILVLDEKTANKKSEHQSISDRIYVYLQKEKNQEVIFTSAVALNDGKSANACVFFVSEVLRKNHIDIPKGICNTGQIITLLTERGWKKDYDFKKLQPGDLCFTTDEAGSKNGAPSHTYIFMGWVKENNYDYAYICDNQAKDYNNKIYHIRNIKDRVKVEGLTKDAFSFFMRPS